MAENDNGFMVNSDIIVRKKKETPKEKHTRIYKEILVCFLIMASAFFIAVFVDKFVVFNSYVPTPSMEPTVHAGDKIMSFRMAYLFKNPQRNDIIVFRFPDDEKQTFMKRVIGIPGDKIEIVQGVLYINDEEVEEPFIKAPMIGSFGPYYVPEESYFVMGDNRNLSDDSRYWTNTYVTKKQIIAKAWFRYKPGFKKIK